MRVKNYLRIKGLAGNSKDPGHVGDIDLLKYAFVDPEKRVSSKNLSFMLNNKRAAVLLLQIYAEGRGIDEVILFSENEVKKDKRILTVKIVMKNVYVVYINNQFDYERKIYFTKVSLSFGKINFEYGNIPQNPFMPN